MAVIRPFHALRPHAEVAPRVAAVPYDVVDVDEARALATGNPLSFLHVSRAEIDFPPGTDPHGDEVYRAAAARYDALKREAPLIRDTRAALYLYALTTQGHEQTGVVGCFSVDEYRRDVIRKHERTRRDKEDDRTRHIMELRAHTGPVFLVHPPDVSLKAMMRRVTMNEGPLTDFTAEDGVRHTIWKIGGDETHAFTDAFSRFNALYIADGHHRAASAARASAAMPDSEDAASFLAVAFPADELRILPYHRIVRDLNGKTAERLLADIRRTLPVAPGPAEPRRKGEVSMYLDGQWYVVTLAGGSLDGELLHEQVLTPILGIGDVRIDKRIDFVGGARGTQALERAVDRGAAAVAFSMYPVAIEELMAVSDAGGIMPPKSTWFEPKLRDGLLIHEI